MCDTAQTASGFTPKFYSVSCANIVRAALIDIGTCSDRIGTHGKGESCPIAGGNSNATGRQLNRRVKLSCPMGMAMSRHAE